MRTDVMPPTPRHARARTDAVGTTPRFWNLFHFLLAILINLERWKDTRFDHACNVEFALFTTQDFCKIHHYSTASSKN